MALAIKTTKKQEMIDITGQVNKIISQKGLKDGMCNVFVTHTTAAITINENWDPNIIDDFFKAINKAIPEHARYQHDNVDGNAQSHIISALMKPSETIPVRKGKLALGKWQSLMLVELDGPMERNIEVTLK